MVVTTRVAVVALLLLLGPFIHDSNVLGLPTNTVEATPPTGGSQLIIEFSPNDTLLDDSSKFSSSSHDQRSRLTDARHMEANSPANTEHTSDDHFAFDLDPPSISPLNSLTTLLKDTICTMASLIHGVSTPQVKAEIPRADLYEGLKPMALDEDFMDDGVYLGAAYPTAVYPVTRKRSKDGEEEDTGRWTTWGIIKAYIRSYYSNIEGESKRSGRPKPKRSPFRRGVKDARRRG